LNSTKNCRIVNSIVSEWNCDDCPTYERVQLVLFASAAKTPMCHSGHSVITVHFLPYCKSHCGWFAKLPWSKTGKY